MQKCCCFQGGEGRGLNFVWILFEFCLNFVWIFVWISIVFTFNLRVEFAERFLIFPGQFFSVVGDSERRGRRRRRGDRRRSSARCHDALLHLLLLLLLLLLRQAKQNKSIKRRQNTMTLRQRQVQRRLLRFLTNDDTGLTEVDLKVVAEKHTLAARSDLYTTAGNCSAPPNNEPFDSTRASLPSHGMKGTLPPLRHFNPKGTTRRHLVVKI